MSENLADHFAALARTADRIRDGVTDAQSALGALEATGHGGGGLVRATVSGQGRLVALDIDPSVIDPQDPRTLSEMVMAAVDAANEAMAAQRAERLDALTGGLADIVDQLHAAPAPRGRVEPMFPSRRPGSSLPQLPFPPGMQGAPDGNAGPGGGRSGKGRDNQR
ncbi:YbaB/EbfC family nucleoid-associated protein [Streptomyces sp. NRRL F-5123]|uniref:YbaB/EbfC family nucleoid-associated protein n=1 Tax=Streptomyces sp. NRRL F-5123 TaxID=1463856 RepID=UPI0006950254|nr:YbaB/EbfC family nucleoid-associated protein [Streptomyces sp. NRRL F-5123]